MEDIEGKTFKVKAYGKVTIVRILLTKYEGNNRIAILLEDAYTLEPFGKLTVNLPGVTLEPDEILVKGWSENEALANAAIETGLFERTGKIVPTGFAIAEIWKIK